jgi:hypothetical protein
MIDKKLIAGAFPFPINREAPVTIDRSGGNRGKEKEEADELGQCGSFDDTVAQTENEIERAKGDVGNPEKAELLMRVELCDGQGQDRQRDREIKSPTRTSRSHRQQPDNKPLPNRERRHIPNGGLILDR